MATFKERVFGSKVDREIIKKLASIPGGASKTNALDEVKPAFAGEYMGDRTPFSRMWCAVNINKLPKTGPNGEIIERNSDGLYYYHPNGDKTQSKIVGGDEDSETLVFSVNENRERSYEGRNLLGSVQQGESSGNVRYVSQLSEELGAGNPYLKPAAGITSVTSKTQGALGAIRSTVVEFTVHNRHDFENIFLPYFLRPGAVVCVDYGWSDRSFQLYDPVSQIVGKTLDMSEFNKFIYDKETGFLIRNQGLVNTVMGNVVTYDSSVNTDGSFQCSLEITSRNTGILDKEISSDNKLRFIFTNVIDDIIRIALASSAGVDSDDINQSLRIIQKSITGQSAEEFQRILSSEEYENLSRQFLEKIDFGRTINDERSTDPLLSPFAKTFGVFYQDISNDDSTVTNFVNSYARHFDYFNTLAAGLSQDLNSPKEVLYITWGRFEDMFLNNFVVGTLRNKSITEDGKENLYKTFDTDELNSTVQYDSRESFVRWDEDLYQMQLQPLSSQDTLPTFIMPKSIQFKKNTVKGEGRDQFTYNVNVLKNTKTSLYDQPWFPKDCSEELTEGEFIGKRIIPFRDIFVSVNLIQQAFALKDNVNDALIFILDALNEDSYKIWNLKLSSVDNSNSSIAAYDANLQPRLSDDPKDTLEFDITSEGTIVSECSLKFTTPKDGLSSMIAIDSLATARHFREHNLAALNNLNLLNNPLFTSGKKSNADQYVSVRSLPLQDTNSNTDEPSMNLNFSKLNTAISKERHAVNSFAAANSIDAFKKSQQNILAQVDQGDAEIQEYRKENAVYDYGENDVVSSTRDIYRQRAKRKLYDDSDQDTISPILPIEIDLSIYGNNYLNIGDYYTVNYLPSQYRERTYFQIVGIEDKIDVNGWQTSYTSVMRVNPIKKSIVSNFELKSKGKSKTKKENNPVIDKKDRTDIYDTTGGKLPGYSNYRKVESFNFGPDALAFDVFSYKYSRLPDTTLMGIHDSGLRNIYHQSPIGNVDDLKYTRNVAYAYAIRNILLNGQFLINTDKVGVKGVDVLVGSDVGKKDITTIGTTTYDGLERGSGQEAYYKVFISTEDQVENLINLYDPSNTDEIIQEKFEQAMQFVNQGNNAPKSLDGHTEYEFGLLEGKIPTVNSILGFSMPKFVIKGVSKTTALANDIVGGSKFPTFPTCIAMRGFKLDRDTKVLDKGGKKVTVDEGETIFALQQRGAGIKVFPTIIIPAWLIKQKGGLRDMCQLLNDTYLVYEQRITTAMRNADYLQSIYVAQSQ